MVVGTRSFHIQVPFNGLSGCDQSGTQYMPRMDVIYLDYVTFSTTFSECRIQNQMSSPVGHQSCPPGP